MEQVSTIQSWKSFSKLIALTLSILFPLLILSCKKSEEPYTPLMMGTAEREIAIIIENEQGENIFTDANSFKEVTAKGLESGKALTLNNKLESATLIVGADYPNSNRYQREIKDEEELPTDFVLSFRGASIRLTAIFVASIHPRAAEMYGGSGLRLNKVKSGDAIIKRADYGKPISITLAYKDGKLSLKR